MEVKVVEKQSGVQIKYQEGVKEAVFVNRFLFGQEKTKYLREGLKQVLKWIIQRQYKRPSCRGSGDSLGINVIELKMGKLKLKMSYFVLKI